MKRLIILSFIIALVSVSCTKNIHLNLQNAAGLLVIEGNINNQPGPYTVYLSKTATYYDSNNIVPVSGGRITISDDAGMRDSLIEVSPGTYHTTTITGTVGRTYHLSVNSGGKQYDAYSKMNPSVPIDSVGILTLSFFGRSQSRVYILYKDPAAVSNFYKGLLYVSSYYSPADSAAHVVRSSPKQTKVNALNDNLNNGLTTETFMRTDNDLNKFDTVTAELDAIDQPMYNYWNSLNSSTLSSQSAAPANPTSNISNNALGYFSAYGVAYSHTIVRDTSAAGFHRIN
jgi:hypothetical protein